MARILLAIMAAALAACGTTRTAAKAPAGPVYSVVEKSIGDLQADLTAGKTTSEQLVTLYLARIEAVDRSGPTLRSVIGVEPDALAQARALDAERKAGHVRGPLHGIPILLKDNIDVAGALPTTAGSLALKANLAAQDAPLVARLRSAGAIILGKTNLSEWANIRSGYSVSGWSAVGGLTRNPYMLDRNACGSSSGSGAATAASLAAAAIGTETDGSITCPASVQGLVGLKPTVGLVARTGIVPISHSQDTAGPMARSVTDAALVLEAIAGSDPADPATRLADQHKADYAVALNADALKGKRIAVLRFLTGYNADLDAQFEAALDILRAAGADLVEVKKFDAMSAINEAELTVLLTELKVDLNLYLAQTPAGVTTRTLADVIAFDKATPAETALFGQDLFEKAEATTGLADPKYIAARAKSLRLAGPLGIDRLLKSNRADALVAPTLGPSWVIDLIAGDHVAGSATTLAAVAGDPHITVPMGEVKGLPVGLSFMGEAWSEAKLLGFAFAFESRARARQPPAYIAHSEELEPFKSAILPAR